VGVPFDPISFLIKEKALKKINLTQKQKHKKEK